MKPKISKTFVIVMLIWSIITLIRVAFHQAWYDEAHAYIIAKELSFLDIISLMNIEGHTFIWYMLIKPFAKLDLWYPYPMMILNWLFIFIGMLIFWKKAPLHTFTKTVVTFSYPFFAQLPIIARCYTIGVMFLFILASMYKDKLKNPLFYSLCIVLCANTSVMALYGAAAFGFIFAYDLIKGALDGIVSRKDFRISFSIMAAGAVLILWQLGGANANYLVKHNEFLKVFLEFAQTSGFIAIGTFLLALLLLPLCLYKYKKSLFFFLFTIGGLICTFIVKYAGWAHHYIFLWIYLLISAWLWKEENTVSGSKNDKFIEVLIAVLFVGQIFSFMTFSINYFFSASKYFADKLAGDKSLQGNRLILYSWFDSRILPYMKGSNIELYRYCSAAPVNWDASLMGTPLCADDENIYPSWLHNSLTEDKESFIILPVKKDKFPEHDFSIEDRLYKMNLTLMRVINKTYGIFKITEIKNNHNIAFKHIFL